MELRAISLNHENNNIKDLEKIHELYILKNKKIEKIINKNNNIINDWIILVTPTNFDIYALATKDFKNILSDIFTELEIDNSKLNIQEFKEKEALEHITKTFAGTKSIILGNKTIFRQAKRAFIDNKTHFSKKGQLSIFYDYAIKLALKLRNRTQIEKGLTTLSELTICYLNENIKNYKKNIFFNAYHLPDNDLLNYIEDKKPKEICVNSNNINLINLEKNYKINIANPEKNSKVLSKIDIIINFQHEPLSNHELNKKCLIIDLTYSSKFSKNLKDFKKIDINTFKNQIKENNKTKQKIKEEINQKIKKEIDEIYKNLILKTEKKEIKKTKKISDKKIKAYTLENAIKHNGKPHLKSILNKLFKEGLAKEDIKDASIKINQEIKNINNISLEDQEKEFNKYQDLILEKKEKEDLPELQNIQGKVITRIAPEPSKHIHIGHAMIFIIQYLYAKKYQGYAVLRLEDTNPEKSNQEFCDEIKKDLKWLNIKWKKEFLASNNLKKLYELAQKLINQNDAYVCTCTPQLIKELRDKNKTCPCRDKTENENLKDWKSMLNRKYLEGKATLRLKGDPESTNGALKDPIIFRISFKEHFIHKDKYCVWPMYDFENSIEDSLCNITHVIRTKEFEMREELHRYILYLLNLKMPNIKEIGRYNIKGAITQGREIREKINQGIISGWDDPRLVTVKALRKRGFSSKMFEELAKKAGLSKSDGNIDYSLLEALNKQIIDSKSKRYFFIEDPTMILVKEAPQNKIEIPLHPSNLKMGNRRFNTKNLFYISEKDYQEFESSKKEYLRLMHLFNIKRKNKDFIFESKNMDKNLKAPLIHWLPADNDNLSELIDIEIVMPNNDKVHGKGEKAIKEIKEDEVVQFERFGFVRLDQKNNNKYIFYYAHN